MLVKILAAARNPRYVAAALAIAAAIAQTLTSAIEGGDPLTWGAVIAAVFGAFASKWPSDSTKPQVDAKLITARLDAARAARISSSPPRPYEDAFDEITPRERHKGGQS